MKVSSQIGVGTVDIFMCVSKFYHLVENTVGVPSENSVFAVLIEEFLSLQITSL